MQRAPVHLPCAGVPSPTCHATPRALTVVVVVAAPKVPAVAVAVAGVVAVVVAAASGAAVEDTWAAVGTRGASTCTGPTHTGGTRSSKASFPDPSSSADTRTAAHTHTHTAAATPPSLSAEHVERAKDLKYGKAHSEAVIESNVHTA